MTKKLLERGKFDKFVSKSNTVGENIKHLREKHKMSPDTFAQKVYMSTRKIRDIEKGKIDIKTLTFEDAKYICEALQVSVSALFFNTSLNEIRYEPKTGLSAEIIHWLEEAKIQNPKFIDYLKEMSTDPKLINIGLTILTNIKKYL